jgi:hypothetical protein
MPLKFLKAKSLLSLTLLSSVVSVGLVTPVLANPVKTHKPSTYPSRVEKLTPKSSVYSPIAKPARVQIDRLDPVEPTPKDRENSEILVHFPVMKPQHTEVKIVIEMSCPPGETITHLSYQPYEQDAIAILSQPTPFNTYAETMTTQLSKAEKINQVYQKLQALQDNFAKGGFPTDLAQLIPQPSMIVNGQCSNELQVTKQQFPIKYDDLKY